MLDYRNTPHSNNIGSLVKQLMERQTKMLIPTTEKYKSGDVVLRNQQGTLNLTINLLHRHYTLGNDLIK